MPQDTSDGVQLKRIDAHERFVAFAFAAADLLAEVDRDGRITYAAGAFRSRLGLTPEQVIGRMVAELVAPSDRETLETALLLLGAKGRLQPAPVRLANQARTRLAMAGLALGPTGSDSRLCLTFSVMPSSSEERDVYADGRLARSIPAQVRSGAIEDIGLLELVCENASLPARDVIDAALETLLPAAHAGELAPGRYGLFGTGGNEADLVRVAQLLEQALRGQGAAVDVSSRHLAVADGALTRAQAARALRHALHVFSRDGGAGLDASGFAGGLAGYVGKAAAHTAALRRAIVDGKFDLSFQPIVTLSDRRLHHYEALIRPHRLPGCPFESPQDFVLLIETLGLAEDLDYAVARMACGIAEHAGVPVAFNLSGHSVQSASMRGRLSDLLGASTASRSGQVIVELTETAEIEDISEAVRTAEAFAALGVPFCLDDFGAGRADVQVLRAVPASMVKLDGSYVPSFTRGGRDRAFVAGMVEIIRATGAVIVAERIETEEEAAAAQEIGIQLGQGWLFGRPGPLPAAEPRPAPPRRVARRSGREREMWG